MIIPEEYISSIPEKYIEEFNDLANTKDETLMNEAFVRFSILGTEKHDRILESLDKEVLLLEQLLNEGVSELNNSELIPETRKERFSDTFSILKEDIVRRYKTIVGEI